MISREVLEVRVCVCVRKNFFEEKVVHLPWSYNPYFFLFFFSVRVAY